MSTNIDPIKNNEISNGSSGLTNQEADADSSSVKSARSSINDLTSSLSSNSSTNFTGTYTVRANNRRYSYAGIRDADLPQGRDPNANADSDTSFTGAYTTRANNRRYSYAGIREADGTSGQTPTDDNQDTTDTSFTGTYTTRANNRRYSYAGIREADGTSGQTPTDDNQDTTDTSFTGTYTTRANNRRYSYAGIREADGSSTQQPDNNQDTGDTTFTGTYTVRANNRRYSYGGIRQGDDNVVTPRDPNQTFDIYTPAPRFSAGLAKDLARTRRLTAQDQLFKQESGGNYSYGAQIGSGQIMSREEAQDSLFYSDVANALMDNGFALTTSQQRDVKNFQHDFSDEFAAFADVRSDLLYTQAAIVDTLIENGAFLTAQQEIDLGIAEDLTSS